VAAPPPEVVGRLGPLLLPAATLAAVLAAVLLARNAVFLQPLNVDEELTLRLGQFSFGHIFHIVSTQRGGGPFHFWLEHFLLGWWPGLNALRLPSLVFFCLGLAGAAVVARDLAGREVAAAVVLLLAASPVPESYATFGRPHTMLFAWLMWGTAVALRAVRTGSRRWWAAGGFALGTSVFVHPTAPLYALVAFGAALLLAPRPPRELVREAWPGAVALVVGFLPYYLATLHVLTDRYGVGAPGGRGGRTFDRLPVWEDAVHFLAPGPRGLNYFTALAAVGVVALLAARRVRLLLFLAATVLAPVVFFSVVPTNGTSALFFDRYTIPSEPAFLVAVVAGCAAVARWAGRWRLVVLAILVAGLFAIEVRIDVPRQRAMRALSLGEITHAVAAAGHDAVLFGTTGSTNPDNFAPAFTFGRPATILDRYLSLRIPSLRVVDDDACARVVPFLTGPATPVHGLWVFYAAFPVQWAAAQEAFAPLRSVTVERPTPATFLLRSREALPPEQLVRLGMRLRLRWRAAVPQNPRVNELLIADRDALRAPGACPVYGTLGDPDISPHWPPLSSKS
jgi:4-amino-4-deoxy-L-arabinose transferase-like glycosyltransferase